MAEIKRYPFLRHLRSEASHHVIRFRKGHAVEQGRGLSFWFQPLGTSVAEVPMDDRDLPFLFHGQSEDYQEVSVQGVVTWRILDPDLLNTRVDFSIDLGLGLYLAEPLDQIATLLTGMAQQYAIQYLVAAPIAVLVQQGPEPIQQRIEAAFAEDRRLQEMGLQVISVRVSALKPSADLEKALQTPTWEALQQKADEATFERRALAVDKERAIAENELGNKIELTKRAHQLIDQEGENARKKAEDGVASRQIEADGEALRLRTVEQARVDMEQARMTIYRDLPPSVLTGLAARDFAKKLTKIEHLNLTPDLLGSLLGDLAQAGAERLRDKPEA